MAPKKKPAKAMSAEFVERMAASRKSQGLTQAELADRVTALGVPTTRETIAKTETEARGLMLDDAVAYAAALGPSLLAMMVSVSNLDDPVAVTPGLHVPARHARAWLAGRGYLRDGSPAELQAIANERSPEERIIEVQVATGMIVRLVEKLVDAVIDADKEAVADVVDDLRSALEIQERSIKNLGA